MKKPVQPTQNKLKEMHNGVYQVSYKDLFDLMTEAIPIVDAVRDQLQYSIHEYTIDVKVHMLMPNQYPCIPNWHFDFVPRDSKGKKKFDEIQPNEKMYMYVSNHPTPEFMHGGKVRENTWITFSQKDEHRGTMSNEFIWRMFIRLVPHTIYKPKIIGGLRRHSQVYLNANEFEW